MMVGFSKVQGCGSLAGESTRDIYIYVCMYVCMYREREREREREERDCVKSMGISLKDCVWVVLRSCRHPPFLFSIFWACPKKRHMGRGRACDDIGVGEQPPSLGCPPPSLSLNQAYLWISTANEVATLTGCP